MKQLHGLASVEVDSPIDACFAVLAALEDYPSWYPEVVRAVAVLDRDKHGLPTRAQATLHVSHGPLTRDFRLLLAIETDRPERVKLARIPHEPGDGERFDVLWRLHEAARTRIEVELQATLDVPRLLPLGSVGEAFAEGFVRAAARRLGASA